MIIKSILAAFSTVLIFLFIILFDLFVRAYVEDDHRNGPSSERMNVIRTWEEGFTRFFQTDGKKKNNKSAE